MPRLLLTLIALTLTSCAGYQLGNNKPAALQSITKLYVPTFKNNTLEPRLAVMVTNSVIKQLQATGAYEIVDEDQADATLQGRIDSVDRNQRRAVRNNSLRTKELLVRLKTDYSVIATSGSKIHSGRITSESYVVLDPNFQTSERQAFAEAAERLGVSLASEITDGW